MEGKICRKFKNYALFSHICHFNYFKSLQEVKLPAVFSVVNIWMKRLYEHCCSRLVMYIALFSTAFDEEGDDAGDDDNGDYDAAEDDDADDNVVLMPIVPRLLHTYLPEGLDIFPSYKIMLMMMIMMIVIIISSKRSSLHHGALLYIIRSTAASMILF